MFNSLLVLCFRMSANKPKKKRERKKNDDGEDIGYFEPSDVQKVQILNRLKLDNHYLWGKFQGDMTKEMVSREQKWIEVVNFVKSLGIPNCIKDKKGLLRVWASWKYQFNKKELLDKKSGAAPVKWTECDEIIRDIIGGNIQHRKTIKVCVLVFLQDSFCVQHMILQSKQKVTF